MLKILFNCSTNNIGGGVQNAYNFIINALNDKNINWLLVVSPQVFELFKRDKITDTRIKIIDKSPSRSIRARKEILLLEKEFNPDIVFTMAGPAYVNFKSYHIMGISNPYITHAKLRTFFFKKGLLDIVRVMLVVFYQLYYVKRADTFFFQTKSSRDSFCKRFFFDKENTEIIPNAIGRIFSTKVSYNKKRGEIINIFCPAAAYPHKNLQIIPKIAQELNYQNKNTLFKFTLTLPNESKLWGKIKNDIFKRKVNNFVENIGPFSYQDAAELYNNADIIFIPSVLETFSTTYLEGIACKKPLLVSDLSFASEICENNAVYFNPFSTKDAIQKINDIIDNYESYSSLFFNRESNIKNSGNQNDRYNLIIKKIISIFNCIS